MKEIFLIINKSTASLFTNLGELAILTWQSIVYSFYRPFSYRNLIDQMVRIGFYSLPVVVMTAFATGMVLALQIGFTMEVRLQGTSQYIGAVVGVSFVRELGPVLTALMVTGRIGSAIAAELGTMKVTEQIDALVTLSANPVQYLAVPRFIAAIIMFPVLTITADLVGIIGGAIMANSQFNQNPQIYITQTVIFVKMPYIYGGLFKSFVFGGIMAIVSCNQGFKTYGGAEGVGKSTTDAVVISSITIIISDFLLSSLIIKIFRF